MIPPPPRPTLFPYTTLFRSRGQAAIAGREPYRALRGPRDRVALDLGEALLDDCTPFATRPPGSSAHTLNSAWVDRKSTRLNSSHVKSSYAVFCLKKKRNRKI